MKKIGFVDYYISEWHANNYPEWIRQASERLGEEFAVAYAWAELDASPEDGVTTSEWCAKYGVTQCASIAELCEMSDFVLVLSPSNPEKHLAYAKEVFACGKNTYIDKTFAPDYETARAIFDEAKATGTRFFSTSALRFADELRDVKPSSELRITGGGRSLEEYIIHQIEMAVKVQGTGASSVSLRLDGAAAVIDIFYPDERHTEIRYEDSLGFSVNGGAVTSDFFGNLIYDILRFYSSDTVSFDTAETLEIIKIRECILAVADGGTVTL